MKLIGGTVVQQLHSKAIYIERSERSVVESFFFFTSEISIDMFGSAG